MTTEVSDGGAASQNNSTGFGSKLALVDLCGVLLTLITVDIDLYTPWSQITEHCARTKKRFKRTLSVSPNPQYQLAYAGSGWR